MNRRGEISFGKRVGPRGASNRQKCGNPWRAGKKEENWNFQSQQMVAGENGVGVTDQRGRMGGELGGEPKKESHTGLSDEKTVFRNGEGGSDF